jgi:hypothetical protein
MGRSGGNKSGGKGRGTARATAVRGAHPAVPNKKASRPRPAGATPRRRGAHATRRNRPSFHLPRPGIPGLNRVAALLVAAVMAAGLAYLATGPWLQVQHVAWSGNRYVAAAELANVLDPVKGTNLLALDRAALTDRLEAVPGVASADVQPSLPGALTVAIHERTPALVWQTSRLRLLAGADGRIFGSVPLGVRMPAPLARLPLIDDRRMIAAYLDPGKTIAEDDMRTALDLARVRPRSIGSAVHGLSIQILDGCGFILAPRSGLSWEAAFGFRSAGTDARSDQPTIDAQLAAVRTLFAAHPERVVRWVDARNPGKVYWRPDGLGGSDTC